MPVTEIYIKLAVAFPRDPKVRTLARYGSDAGLARDLYVQMCLYCKDTLSDGFVPAEEVGALVYPLDAEHGNQLAKQLASVGLTKEVSKNGASGWEVLAFVARNGTREDVEHLSKVRAVSGAAGGRKSRKRPAQGRSKAAGKQVANQSANQDGEQNTSNAVSVSANAEPETNQTPTVSAGGSAPALTVTQRSKRLTDIYAEAEPMCKWPAVNGVVIHAIKSGKYADDEIAAALLRMAAVNRSVTVDSLRTELGGMPPQNGTLAGQRQSTTDQRVAQTQALKAELRGGPSALPPGTIPGSVLQ
jgi:hypothetical protein